MRSIVAASTAFVLFTLGAADAVSGGSMSDPVFGITYDTKKIHFDNAPARLGRFCPEIRGETFWLYAYLRTGHTEYFVLSNETSETSGVGVILDSTKCFTGLPDWPLYGIAAPGELDKSVHITESVMRGLATDLFRRYTLAFGGRENFLREVSEHGLRPSDLPLEFRHQLEEFAKITPSRN